MIFEKKTPKTYTSIEFGIEIRNCQFYSIFYNDIAGQFYCTPDRSVGQILATHLLFEKTKSSILTTNYTVKNLNNNAIVGKLEISNFLLGKSRTRLDIIHQDSYKWRVLKEDRGFSIFTWKIWSKFHGQLSNVNEYASFEWDYISSELYKHKLESLPITGMMTLSNPKNHILLFSGLFLMEMELQMNAID